MRSVRRNVSIETSKKNHLKIDWAAKHSNAELTTALIEAVKGVIM